MNELANNWIKEMNIDMDACIGCKSCMNACFVDVIRWDDENKKPVVAYPEDCVWCLACEVACPEECINIIPNIPAPLRSSF